jgi:hypothetical protein
LHQQLHVLASIPSKLNPFDGIMQPPNDSARAIYSCICTTPGHVQLHVFASSLHSTALTWSLCCQLLLHLLQADIAAHAEP